MMNISRMTAALVILAGVTFASFPADTRGEAVAALVVQTDVEEVPMPADFAIPEEASDGSDGTAVIVDGLRDSAASDTDVIELPLFGATRVSDLGLPLFTFLVGLVDGFNPCAMWVLVFLLSVLVNVKDRRKILLIAGTFVLVSGLAYFAFMAAWLNLFMLIGIARPAQIVLGLMAILIGLINIKDFFAFKQGITLSIPESSKPGIYRRVREIVSTKYLTAALFSVVVLAVIVNMIELLCTAGLPALYTQILTMQDLPAWKNYAYLTLYIAAYMLDDTILLGIVVVTLSHRKLQEREGRWLKMISGTAILVLGVVMIFKPSWLQLAQ
jgi:cytochrome c biogenesis protein CcdA